MYISLLETFCFSSLVENKSTIEISLLLDRCSSLIGGIIIINTKYDMYKTMMHTKRLKMKVSILESAKNAGLPIMQNNHKIFTYRDK